MPSNKKQNLGLNKNDIKKHINYTNTLLSVLLTVVHSFILDSCDSHDIEALLSRRDLRLPLIVFQLKSLTVLMSSTIDSSIVRSKH